MTDSYMNIKSSVKVCFGYFNIYFLILILFFYYFALLSEFMWVGSIGTNIL